MKKISLFSSIMLLSACVTTQTTSVDMPEKIEHNGQIYYLANQQNLGEMQRYFYLKQGESTQHWQSAVDILLDLNKGNRSMTERIALRKKVFEKNRITNFELTEKDNALYAYVIYPPNDKENNYQIDVAKGKNSAECGFAQIQYSQKIESPGELDLLHPDSKYGKLRRNAKKTLAELAQFNWHCHPFDHKTP
ncbi:MAG: hypothetical protein Q4B95_04530 [Lonepinella koalarum]|nr:hypothetical protein [Lonepinella koalarum]